MLAAAFAVEESAALTFPLSPSGVLSWNTPAQSGALEFRITRGGQPVSPWLAYARWSARERVSCSPAHDGLRVDVDVVRSRLPFDGVEVRAADVFLQAVWFATPPQAPQPLAYAGAARILDVPRRSQYGAHGESGWCSAAALSMLNAYYGLDYSVEETAAAIFDRAYGGTGNWAFNVAFSGSLGLQAAVAYLRDLQHAQRLIESGLPIAISYSWHAGELPGAPVEHSNGHLAVLCGFTSDGNCVLNDPAHDPVRTTYPREALERVWMRSGGVAYVIARRGVDLLPIVNS